MAPIPSLLPPETQDAVASLSRRQKDIFDFQIPRLRTCTGPLVTQQQLSAELREDVEVFARNVEVLDGSVDDLRGERSRRELRVVVDEFQDSLVRMRKESRNALLVSKRAVDAGKLSNRDELLRTSAVREKQDLNEKVTEDALMEASNNVTDALQRTIALMQGELEKSVLSSQLLDASTAALKSTSSTHDVLDNLMVTSKHLITALEKSDWLDRMLILAALLFFILIVLFILKQRLVDRSLKIAFFWTRFLPSSSSSAKNAVKDKVVDMVEKGSGGSIVAAVTTASTTLLTAASTAATFSETFSSTLQPSPSPGRDDSVSSGLLDPLLQTVVDTSTLGFTSTVALEDELLPQRTMDSESSDDVPSRDEL
ncbi:hypothetical protein EUX98_g5836 [Antrodiella citrinella]|uniref:Sec20 C-terminal domain-containing protein n=1 Tax=Antrodiella citrinella TaxID=2447956 RepID=A0A4S4MQH8_9APHY|nr:hypothetical protein EUX98_g5836 [Antrodiella citrinella]